MTIGRLVFLALGVIGVIALIQSVTALRAAHVQLQQDLQLQALALTKSDWIDGTVAMSFERSVTQVAFALDDPAPDAFLALIDEQRALSDRLLNQAETRIADMTDFDNANAFLARVAADRAAMADIRTEVDGLLRRGADARDARRSHALPYEIKDRIEALYAASELLRVSGGNRTSYEEVLSTLQNRAWEIREYGGRARTHYAIATLTGTAIPPEFHGEARIDTARARAGWQTLEAAVASVALPDSIMDSIAQTRAAFMVTYMDTLDAIDTAMATSPTAPSVDMPISFEDFFALSNAGLDAVAGLSPRTAQLIYAYWENRVDDAARQRMIAAVKTLILLALLAGTGLVLRNRVTRRLEATVAALRGIAEGDLTRGIAVDTTDLSEIRAFSAGLENLTHKLGSAQEEAQRAAEAERQAQEGLTEALLLGLEKMARGDLTHEIPNEFGQGYAALVDNFNSTNRTLKTLLTEVIATANEIAENSIELRTAIDDLARRTDGQAASVAQTASSLETFARNLQDMAENAVQSDKFVRRVNDKAEASGDVVDTAVSAMERIKASTADINKFTTVIDEIAFQTGLLALNAGVEAARAGEAGRGFAVVASEIRNLAQNASDSATQIKNLVSESVDHVETGAQHVMETGSSLREIITMVQGVRESIGEISDASQNQSAGVQEIGSTMDTIDTMTKQNAAMVEQATANSAFLQQKADALKCAVSRFTIGQETMAGADGMQAQRVA